MTMSHFPLLLHISFSISTFTSDNNQYRYNKNEVFIGLHEESVPSIVKTQLKRYQKEKEEHNRPLAEMSAFLPHLVRRCKEQLLRTLSYDGLVRISMSQCEEYEVCNYIMYYHHKTLYLPLLLHLLLFTLLLPL